MALLLDGVHIGEQNEKVLTPFLRSLVERGLDVSQGLLLILDGGKGLYQPQTTAASQLVHRERLGVGMFVLQRPFAKLSASSAASTSSSEMSTGQP